jgi:DNA-binding response OmpR family regulator
MPGMTGPDLAKEIRRSRPYLRVLLISGYTQGVLILDEGWHFLKKPFLPDSIIAKVQNILRKPPASATDRG